jgi:hypothetical protein
VSILNFTRYFQKNLMSSWLQTKGHSSVCRSVWLCHQLTYTAGCGCSPELYLFIFPTHTFLCYWSLIKPLFQSQRVFTETSLCVTTQALETADDDNERKRAKVNLTSHVIHLFTTVNHFIPILLTSLDLGISSFIALISFDGGEQIMHMLHTMCKLFPLNHYTAKSMQLTKQSIYCNIVNLGNVRGVSVRSAIVRIKTKGGFKSL